jgi:hypothetical protein
MRKWDVNVVIVEPGNFVNGTQTLLSYNVVFSSIILNDLYLYIPQAKQTIDENCALLLYSRSLKSSKQNTFSILLITFKSHMQSHLTYLFFHSFEGFDPFSLFGPLGVG